MKGGIAAEGINDFDAGDVLAQLRVWVGGIADGFEAALRVRGRGETG